MSRCVALIRIPISHADLKRAWPCPLRLLEVTLILFSYSACSISILRDKELSFDNKMK